MHQSRYIRLGELRVPRFRSRLLQMVGRSRSWPRLASGPVAQELLVTEIAGTALVEALSFKVFTSFDPALGGPFKNASTGGQQDG